jgi:Uma2 family endonuclease
MSVLTLLGPKDHGRPIKWEELRAARRAPGYHYELIRGRLYVSPEANAPQNWLEMWLLVKLVDYARERPDVINFVTPKSRVIHPEEPEETKPEPDLAAFHGWPTDAPVAEMDWRDQGPILVVEVLGEDEEKDLVRNVELYLEMPTIKEYWIVDPRESADRPALLVYRRRGQRWQRPIHVAGGQTYTTRLLPGFSLLLDAHQ